MTVVVGVGKVGGVILLREDMVVVVTAGDLTIQMQMGLRMGIGDSVVVVRICRQGMEHPRLHGVKRVSLPKYLREPPVLYPSPEPVVDEQAECRCEGEEKEEGNGGGGEEEEERKRKEEEETEEEKRKRMSSERKTQMKRGPEGGAKRKKEAQDGS
jgi:hypothetical protein